MRWSLHSDNPGCVLASGKRMHSRLGRGAVVLGATREARDARKCPALVPPYHKFESISLQRRVCELSVPEHHAINPPQQLAPATRRVDRVASTPCGAHAKNAASSSGLRRICRRRFTLILSICTVPKIVTPVCYTNRAKSAMLEVWTWLSCHGTTAN